MSEPEASESMSELNVGRPDVSPETPSHSRGSKTGHQPGRYKRSPGHEADNKSTARRSTGIRARHKDPIVPGAPNVSPP